MNGRVHEILTALLARRGISEADEESFLHPSLSGLAAPESLPGIPEAVDAILSVAAPDRKIVVFGDYDCDGVCSVAILLRALSAIGASAVPFLPDRLSEGYGMTDASLARMLSLHSDAAMVVTVDNGINSAEQVGALRERGIKVVVTDHHLPGETLPDADALVNPKVAAPPELSDLCGAGVAFMLANKLVTEARRRCLYSGPSVGGPLLVMAGLATVTDVMPLLGQNRILVAEALRRFDRFAPVGLRELHLRASRIGADFLSSKDFSHGIGPRMNAAGRIASADDALALLMTDDRERARELARVVDGRNVERKNIEQRMLDDAMSKIVPDAPAQVIDLPDGHPGVAGIVAARVMERLGETVPVCVVASGRGSARSPEWINVRDALASCGDAIDRFGGHAVAAGFSVKDGRMDEFRRRFCDICAACAASGEPSSEPNTDIWLEPSDVTLELAEALQLMEPFGEGNPEPVFGMKDVLFSDARPVGSDGRHLSLKLRGSGFSAVFWNMGGKVEDFRASSATPCTIRFRLAISTYIDRHVELHIASVSSRLALASAQV